MKTASTLPFVLVLAALSALSCTSSSGTSGPSSTTSGTAAPNLKVGVVFDSGGRGDKSFNDSAWAGVQMAQKELNIPDSQVKTVESKSENMYETNLQGMVDDGCTIVFAIGYAQKTALQAVATKNPTVKFGLIDDELDLPNVRSIEFSEEQGSFLAGYLAGLVTKTGKVGFVGGIKTSLIEKFQAGYEAGALTANPKVQVLPAKYTGSWDDVSLGKASATTLYDQGADIVYQAAGRCGLGVIDAAKEANKFAIGVDGDQDGQAPGRVLTSMVKHVDNAVLQTIKDVKDGKFTPGLKRYDLAAGGVGLTDFQYTKDVIGQANLDKLAAETKKVADGEIKPPTTVADEAAFLKSAK